MTNEEIATPLDELVTQLESAQNTLNDVFVRLGKITDSLHTLVQTLRQPQPGPPINPAPIKFSTHRYYLGGPKPVADYYDLQYGPYLTLTDFPMTSQKYRYATTARSLQDTPGDRQLVPPNASVSWVALDPNGMPVSRPSNGDQLLNISSPELYSRIRDNLPALLRGFDGLYLDEVDETWKYGYPGFLTTKQWANDAQWQNALTVFVKNLSDDIHHLSKKLWVNLGAGATSPIVAPIIQAADGVNIEYFIGREKINLPVATGADYLSAVQRVQLVEKGYGKACHVHVSTSTQAVVDRAFYAWLLGTEFRGSFTASLDYGGSFGKPSASILDPATRLSLPLGPYITLTGGVLQREFQGGWVRVEPDGQGSITLKSNA